VICAKPRSGLGAHTGEHSGTDPREDWGDPREYNLTINKKGQKLETEYTVQPSPKTPAPAEALAQLKAMAIDLDDQGCCHRTGRKRRPNRQQQAERLQGLWRTIVTTDRQRKGSSDTWKRAATRASLP
jgi:hypothetical protein